MSRHAVKVLLMDPAGKMLLIHGRDSVTGTTYWYPVGGGVEHGETARQAARRETWEETGLTDLPHGDLVWTRHATYTHGGRTEEMHEEWLHVLVRRFDPAPARLTESEAADIVGFRWWSPEELAATSEVVYPVDLGTRLLELRDAGLPAVPIDISATA